MKNLEIREQGVMLSDYFHGTSGVWLNIHVDNTTTLKQVIEYLEIEINSVYDHIQYTAEHHNFNIDLIEDQIENQILIMKQNIKNKQDQIYKSDLDFCFDDMQDDMQEYPVAIFTIEFIEE